MSDHAGLIAEMRALADRIDQVEAMYDYPDNWSWYCTQARKWLLQEADYLQRHQQAPDDDWPVGQVTA